jgi:hypothetical protein
MMQMFTDINHNIIPDDTFKISQLNGADRIVFVSVVLSLIR